MLKLSTDVLCIIYKKVEIERAERVIEAIEKCIVPHIIRVREDEWGDDLGQSTFGNMYIVSESGLGVLPTSYTLTALKRLCKRVAEVVRLENDFDTYY